jgi:hypothetical protein
MRGWIVLCFALIVTGRNHLTVTIDDDSPYGNIFARLCSLGERVNHESSVCHTFTLIASAFGHPWDPLAFTLRLREFRHQS